MREWLQATLAAGITRVTFVGRSSSVDVEKRAAAAFASVRAVQDFAIDFANEQQKEQQQQQSQQQKSNGKLEDVGCIVLGGVALPERHVKRRDEPERLCSKHHPRLGYFITQVVYCGKCSYLFRGGVLFVLFCFAFFVFFFKKKNQFYDCFFFLKKNNLCRFLIFSFFWSF